MGGNRRAVDAGIFARYRKQGGMVAIHSIPEEIVKTAMADPTVMIASDGILDHGKGHPRAAGTYARVLARYVREEQALSLTDALAKMSLMPANLLRYRTKEECKRRGCRYHDLRSGARTRRSDIREPGAVLGRDSVRHGEWGLGGEEWRITAGRVSGPRSEVWTLG